MLVPVLKTKGEKSWKIGKRILFLKCRKCSGENVQGKQRLNFERNPFSRFTDNLCRRQTINGRQTTGKFRFRELHWYGQAELQCPTLDSNPWHIDMEQMSVQPTCHPIYISMEEKICEPWFPELTPVVVDMSYLLYLALYSHWVWDCYACAIACYGHIHLCYRTEKTQ